MKLEEYTEALNLFKDHLKDVELEDINSFSLSDDPEVPQRAYLSCLISLEVPQQKENL